MINPTQDLEKLEQKLDTLWDFYDQAKSDEDRQFYAAKAMEVLESIVVLH